MNEEYLRSLYDGIGLNDKQIDTRLLQARMLHRSNDVGSVSGKGGGAHVLYDNNFRKGRVSHMPVVVKNADEAAALWDHWQDILIEDDTYSFNLSSNGVPLPLLTIWTTRMIEAIYKEMTLNKVTGSWQQGVFGIQQIKIPTIAFDASISPYSDLSSNGSSTINNNWVTRNAGYFEISLNYGDMQQAQYTLAKIDYVTKVREAMAVGLSQFQNDVGFQGYTGIPDTDSPHLWGILNEPNANAAISLPADGIIPGTTTPTVAWSGKDFLQILRDIRLLFAQALLQGVGHISVTSKCKLVIPPTAEAALTTPNAIGDKSVYAYLKDTYSGLELVTCANFEAQEVTTGEVTGETACMLMFAHPKTGEMPFDELFVTKWNGHRPVAMSSNINEKVSCGLGGVVLKYPLFLVKTYGI